jgi:allantoicase
MNGAQARDGRHDFSNLPDLASRRVGGSVVGASDELFAERENLIKPEPPVYSPHTFGHKGQVYDGWETRRRREPGDDFALIRLGLPGVVRGIVVDTAFFTGNFPPEISVEGCAVEGYPSPGELVAADWMPLVPRTAAAGDTANEFAVRNDRRVTHVRLCMYPDGGIARLRVHGEAVPDPRLLGGGYIDLAALANGAQVTGCSNMFYSSPSNLISPGLARNMGEGWETARRRDDGNDWVEIRLAAPGVARLAELDTSYFVGNAPGWASLRGRDRRAAGEALTTLLPRTRLQPDTPHRFRLDPGPEVTDIRLDIYPDGGMARLRLLAALAEAARDDLALRWFNVLPESHAAAVLAASGDTAQAVLAARPLSSVAQLPAGLRAQLHG